MIQTPPIIQHARSGAAQALAWTGMQRNALLLDLPTTAELDCLEFNVPLRQGLFGPKDCPRISQHASAPGSPRS